MGSHKLLLALVLGISLYGCKHSKTEGVPTPFQVDVATAVADSIPTTITSVGYLASMYDAVIQPRVNGYLLSIRYKNGMPVKKGSLIFTIDDNLLSTTMLSAEAALESARAQELEAANNYNRAIPLARINAISQTELDQYEAQYVATKSSVRSALQALRNARLEVSYTRIYSPINGIVSSTNATVGDYVGPNTQFTVLTTISYTDSVTIDVSIPVSQYLPYAKKGITYDNSSLLSNIRLQLADGSTYQFAGQYSYTRKDITDNVGTIAIVVKFPNHEHLLKEGQFGRVVADIGARQPRVLIPQRAVSQVQGVNSVWLVLPDSTVQYRKVDLGPTYGDMWVVNSGVEIGDMVLTTGMIKVHDKEKVIPIKR